MVLTDTVHAIHVVDNLRASSGGPSRSVTAVCDALARTGAQVSVLTAEMDPSATLVPPREALVDLDVLATNARAGLWRGAATPFGLALTERLREPRSAVVHTHGLWVPSNRAAALAATQAECPVVISPKGMLSKRALAVKRRKKQIGWHLFQRSTLHQAAAFQATSMAEAQDIRRMGFRQPVAVIPHGVTVPETLPTRPNRPIRTALFMSRFHSIKGVPDLIEAWACVRPTGWRLRLVGPDEGGHRAEIERLVIKRGLADVVDIRGPVSEADKGALFASADLFVLATHSENFGVVIAEALAAGLPVITTHGAPWQALEVQRCGWWVKTGAAPFASALREATAASSDVLRAMGNRGRAYVARDLSWDRSAQEHLALYRWLLGHGSQPATVQ